MECYKNAFNLQKQEVEFILNSVPGSTAVGGIPAALMACFKTGNVSIKPSLEFFSKAVDLKAKVEEADVIITGVEILQSTLFSERSILSDI